MNTINKEVTLTPNFSHRVESSFSAKAALVDSVGHSLNRAAGILSLIYQHLAEIENNNHLADAVFAVENEIKDVKAIVQAFYEYDKQ